MILPQDTDLNFASIAQLFSQADGPIVLVFFSAVVEIELLDDERVNSDTSCTRYSSDIIPVNGLDAELIIQRQQSLPLSHVNFEAGGAYNLPPLWSTVRQYQRELFMGGLASETTWRPIQWSLHTFLPYKNLTTSFPL